MSDDAARLRLIGIALMCANVVALSCLDGTAKYLGGFVGTFMIVWARYASGFLITAVIVNPLTRPGLTVTRRPWMQIARAACILLSTFLHWLGLRYLQLDQAIAIQFSAPFLIAGLSGWWLGEGIDSRRWLAIGVGFAGVLVVTRPGFGGIHPAALLTLASTAFYSIFAVLTRLVVRTDSADTTLFYTQLIGVAVLSCIVPFDWSVPTTALIFGLMALTGVLGAGSQQLMILAHRHASAAVLAPFFYLQVITAPILGFLLFGNVPNRWTIAGAAIVVAAGLYLLHCERMPAKMAPS